MNGDYEFYSDGFFGFGPPGTFKPFTMMHFAPILLCILAVYFVWKKREWFRNTEAQRQALRRLLKELKERYPRALIVGHRNLNPLKACPCFDAVKEYRDLQP